MTAPTGSTASADSVALQYLNGLEARTVEAIAERIIPGDAENAGATEAGVVYYIDRAIAGFSTNLQRAYRLGLRELEAFCAHEHSAQFVDLTPEQQDGVVRLLLGPETGQPSSGLLFGPDDQDQGAEGSATVGGGADRAILHRLFAVVREHTVEGFFCDPAYGGNRDAVGWRLVGFPGAQWGYTAEQMKPGFDAGAIVIKTLSDLRSELTSLPSNEHFNKNLEK
jgi:gluconate 2-dehydrogenase gamma chain